MSSNKNLDLHERMMRAQVKAVLRVYTGGKSGRWPMPMFPESPMIGIYSSPYIADLMWEAFEKLKNDNQWITKLRQTYRYPSILARTPHIYTQRGLWSLTKKQRYQFGDIIAKILSGMYVEDMFCENGTNIIYTNNHVTKLADKLSNNIIIDDHLLLKRLAGMLWILTENFQPRWHNTFHEYSGPYIIGDNKIIIKEFHDLRPSYIPKENISYDWSNITIVEKYEKSASFEFDIHNRFISDNKNEKLLINYVIMVDDSPISKSDMLVIIKELENAIEKSVKYLQSMNKEKIIIFNGQNEYNALIKPLKLLVDLPSDLPASFYEHAKNNTFTVAEEKIYNWMKKVPKDAKGFRNLFDVKSDMIKI